MSRLSIGVILVMWAFTIATGVWISWWVPVLFMAYCAAFFAVGLIRGFMD